MTFTSTLQDIQRRYGPALDEALRRRLSDHSGPHGFYGMLQYQLGYVDENLHPNPFPGGKRFRPLLCLLSCEAVGGAWRQALPVAVAIELLHNFSLIHDDIEDRDPSRRHRPTLWKVWGEPLAIDAGDGMFALAGRTVFDAPLAADHVVTLSSAFQDTSISLTEGQYLDMCFETRDDVATEEYLDMITRKTGALIAFSCWAGALVGGAGEGPQDLMARFGSELGRAFQIRDDIMGIWGTSSDTGKEVAKDLQNRKKTLPLLLAAKHASAAEARELQRFMRREVDDLAMAVAILDRSGVRQIAERSIERHLEAARDALAAAELTNTFQDQLLRLAMDLTKPAPS